MGSIGANSGASVPVHRFHRSDGFAQPRARPTRAGGRFELGQYPALSADQGNLSRPPIAAQTRREVLHDLLDAPAALQWLSDGPAVRLRVLPALSPFAAAWIDPGQPEALSLSRPPMRSGVCTPDYC